MRKSIMYVGMDQHKESIEIATADEGQDGEVRRYGRYDVIEIFFDDASRGLNIRIFTSRTYRESVTITERLMSRQFRKGMKID